MDAAELVAAYDSLLQEAIRIVIGMGYKVRFPEYARLGIEGDRATLYCPEVIGLIGDEEVSFHVDALGTSPAPSVERQSGNRA
jgi:hypothetical protein